MPPSCDTISEWTDFPNGLRVLLIDGNPAARDEISERLRRYHFTVTTFSEVDDAVAAIKSQDTLFHVALVEASVNNDFNSLKILEEIKCLPIIMMIEEENMTIMMQGIALGAADFWIKPLMEEKLRNIWQHVVRKVVSHKDSMLLPSLTPVRAVLDSVLHSTTFGGMPKLGSSGNDVKPAGVSGSFEKAALSEEDLLGSTLENFTSCYKPLCDEVGKIRADLGKVPRDKNTQVKIEKEYLMSNDTGSEDICHTEKGSEDQPSIKTEFDDSVDDATISTGSVVYGANTPKVELGPCSPSPFSSSVQDMNLDESLDSGEVLNSDFVQEQNMLPPQVSAVADSCSAMDFEVPAALNFDCTTSGKEDRRNEQKISEQAGESYKSVSARKRKVDWTPELHRLFVHVVEQLGVEKAIPSKILELMGVKCLTRHNIASHLQKYRSQRKNVHLARDVDMAWTQRQVYDSSFSSKNRQGSSYRNLLPIQPRLPPGCQVVPPITSGNPIVAPFHVWGHPVMNQSSGHILHQPAPGTFSTFPVADGSYLQQPICTSGAPYYVSATRPLSISEPTTGQSTSASRDTTFPNLSAFSEIKSADVLSSEAVSDVPTKPLEFHPVKEIVDAAIIEALSNPSLPLPLGLKSPSIESVMAELQQQGLDTIRLRFS